jgi:hypothetical protein
MTAAHRAQHDAMGGGCPKLRERYNAHPSSSGLSGPSGPSGFFYKRATHFTQHECIRPQGKGAWIGHSTPWAVVVQSRQRTCTALCAPQHRALHPFQRWNRPQLAHVRRRIDARTLQEQPRATRVKLPNGRSALSAAQCPIPRPRSSV